MRAVIFICLALLAIPAAAQNVADLDAARAAELAETRIDEQMVEMTDLTEALANHLGQLHFLRTLCFSDQDQKWRQKAADMLAVEAPGESARRSQLIAAFNAGYYEQQERYQSCTSRVAIDVAALSENGRRLAVMLGDPYRER